MVSNRCKLVVTQVLADYNVAITQISLGQVFLEKEITKQQTQGLKDRLEQFGYELIDDKRAKITAGVKLLLSEAVELEPFDGQAKMSAHLSKKLGYEYHYLSNLFSEIEGITIEKYFILLKIEKVKELIEYGDLSLSAISYKLGHSSPAHLAHQFKQVTGMTPTHFKILVMNDKKSTQKRTDLSKPKT